MLNFDEENNKYTADMLDYMSYEEIQKHIEENPKNLPDIQKIALEIWQYDIDRVGIVMTLSCHNPQRELPKMSDFDSFCVASWCPSLCDYGITGFIQYGQKLKARLKKDYKDKKVTSNLRY